MLQRVDLVRKGIVDCGLGKDFNIFAALAEDNGGFVLWQRQGDAVYETNFRVAKFMKRSFLKEIRRMGRSDLFFMEEQILIRGEGNMVFRIKEGKLALFPMVSDLLEIGDQKKELYFVNEHNILYCVHEIMADYKNLDPRLLTSSEYSWNGAIVTNSKGDVMDYRQGKSSCFELGCCDVRGIFDFSQKFDPVAAACYAQ